MLYIYNKSNLTQIVCKNKITQATKPVISVVKAFCERELFSYENRIKLTKKYLKIKSKIPIYINELILLMPTHSPKKYNSYWINYYEVFSYNKYFDKTLVLFKNLQELVVNVSYNVFRGMMKKAALVDEYYIDRLDNLII